MAEAFTTPAAESLTAVQVDGTLAEQQKSRDGERRTSFLRQESGTEG